MRRPADHLDLSLGLDQTQALDKRLYTDRVPVELLRDLLPQRRLHANLLRVADLIAEPVGPACADGSRVLPVGVDVLRRDVVRLFHVLVVELRYEQNGEPLRTHEEEKGAFQGFKAGPGEVVDAVERGHNEQVEPCLPDVGLQGLETAAIFLGRNSQHRTPPRPNFFFTQL